MENNVIAGKQLITLILKADAWEKTEIESVLKQRVYDVFITDENAQVYFGSDSTLYNGNEEKVKEARDVFNSLTRLTTSNGYIEAYISIDIPNIKIIDFPITLIQDRNELKIESNIENANKEKDT